MQLYYFGGLKTVNERKPLRRHIFYFDIPIFGFSLTKKAHGL